jgi:anti-sigma factor RsiW
MQKPSDETLIAYLDGELDADLRGEVESWLESDAELRDRVAALAMSAEALRAVFEPVLHEPVPERLLAAARGANVGAEIVDFGAAQTTRAPRPLMQRRWARWAAAAGVGGLLIGGGVGYFAGGGYDTGTRTASNAAASN